MKEMFRAIDDAYSLLDKCIDKLLKGRITKNEKLEQEAYCDMEYAVNGAMQNLSYLEGRLKGKTLNEWIKVEDKLPEYNTQCLVKTNYGSYRVTIYIASVNKDKGCFKDEFGWLYCGVTYWMPIVSPEED